MKFRTDFVTNSSSSSFIGVFAKISDNEKVQTIIQRFRLQKDITSGKEILNQMAHQYFWSYGADWAGVDLTPSRSDIEDNAEYILWESYGGAGDDDSAFYKDDYGPNYDVDLSDFEEIEQKIFKGFSESNGFTVLRSGYGAGRDG